MSPGILLAALMSVALILAACPAVPTESIEMPRSIETVKNLPSAVQPGRTVVLGLGTPVQASRLNGQYAQAATDYSQISVAPLNATVLKNSDTLDIDWAFCSVFDEELGPVPGTEVYIGDSHSVQSVEARDGKSWTMELESSADAGEGGKKRVIRLVPPASTGSYVNYEGSEYVYVALKIKNAVYFKGPDIISDYVKAFKISVNKQTTNSYLPVTSLTGLPLTVRNDGHLILGKGATNASTSLEAAKVPAYGPITIGPPEAAVLQNLASLDLDWGFEDNSGKVTYISSTGTTVNSVSANSGSWTMTLQGGGANRTVKLIPPATGSFIDANGSKYVKLAAKVKDGAAAGTPYEFKFQVTTFDGGSIGPQPIVQEFLFQQAFEQHIIIGWVTLGSGPYNQSEYHIQTGKSFHFTGVLVPGAGWTLAQATTAAANRILEIIPGTTTGTFVKTFQEKVTYPNPFSPGPAIPGSGHSIKPAGVGYFDLKITIPAQHNNGQEFTITTRVVVDP